MSMSDAFENALHKLILWGTPIPGLADNAASSPLTQLYLSLHTADPGEGGNQSTSEVTYTGYARVAVPRSNTGWNIAAAIASLAQVNSFPAGTAGSGTGSFWGLGTAASGSAGLLLYTGTVTPTINTGNGVTPQLGTGTTITLD